MELENQVCSLELAKKLKELGVKQESLFYWHDFGEIGWQLSERRAEAQGLFAPKYDCSAFTVAELGEMLPSYSQTHKIAGVPGCWMCGDVIDDDMYCVDGATIRGATEADCRANMLIYLLENKLISL